MIASNPSNLARGERELGIDSLCFYSRKNKFSESCTNDVYFKTPFNLKLIFRILTSDILHFNNGRTLLIDYRLPLNDDHWFKVVAKKIYNFFIFHLCGMDIFFLKLLGKKIVITFQGSDGRINSFARKKFKYTHCNYITEGSDSEYASKLKYKKLNRYIKLSDYIFSVNPDLLYNLGPNSSFLPYTPINSEKWVSNNHNKKFKEPLVIGHAPTNRATKGTDHIENAIDELKNEGYDFKYLKIENIPHNEIKEKLLTLDLLIDQCLAGWYGGVAIEVMSLGIPCMAYTREEDFHFLEDSFKHELKVININPETVKEKLKEFLICSIEEKNKLSKDSKAFALKNHSEKQVAKKTLAIYKRLL